MGPGKVGKEVFPKKALSEVLPVSEDKNIEIMVLMEM